MNISHECIFSIESLIIVMVAGAGHLLGAAGAVEAIFTVLALKHRVAPPTVNLHSPSASFLPGVRLLGHADREVLPEGPAMALTNSFGFGGTNASLVLATAPGTC